MVTAMSSGAAALELRVDREMLQFEIALSATYLLSDEDKENLVSYFFKDLVVQDLGENVGEVVLGGDMY